MAAMPKMTREAAKILHRKEERWNSLSGLIRFLDRKVRAKENMDLIPDGGLKNVIHIKVQRMRVRMTKLSSAFSYQLTLHLLERDVDRLDRAWWNTHKQYKIFKRDYNWLCRQHSQRKWFSSTIPHAETIPSTTLLFRDMADLMLYASQYREELMENEYAMVAHDETVYMIHGRDISIL